MMEPSLSHPQNDHYLTAYFGGGCFWCTEAVFRMIKGVIEVESGYAGGTVEDPTYAQISNGATGHAEVIRVTYNPALISYDDLLTIFFASHDPTTLNRQGADVGEQYRSIIFYQTPEEKAAATARIEDVHKSLSDGSRVVTQVEPFANFYKPGDIHQNFYAANPTAPYCQIVVEPKIEKIRSQFALLLKEKGTE